MEMIISLLILGWLLILRFLEQGAKPVFAINYDDLNISAEEIEKKSPKTKAIICVHYAGNPVEFNKIEKFLEITKSL